MSFNFEQTGLFHFNLTPVLVIGAIALVVGLAVLGYLQEKKRREAFHALAAKLGLDYAEKDYDIPTRYAYLNALDQGDHRYAINVLRGIYETHRVCLFDYHYQTHSTDSKGNRQTTDHFFSFFVLEQDRNLPELRIYPETFLSKLGQALGYQDIDFESAEFSKAFTVRSKDKKFAYDICHTRMMKYLLQHRELSLEIEGPCVAMGFQTRLDPEQIPARLQQLVEIRTLFPEYLYQT